MERLDKIIANTTDYSRKEVKTLVKQGRICVNGVIAASAEMKVNGDNDRITVDGAAVCTLTAPTYVLLHKPAGFLSATEDGRDRTVMELLSPALRRRQIAPVGRLDKDTEGLLLLTDDGELNHRLTSPRHHVDKVYYALVEGVLEESDRRAFEKGIELSDFTCQSAKLEILSPHECLVTVHEGKFHQVKRMLGKCGKPVIYLKRLQMGPLCLPEDLAAGEYRLLTLTEVKNLENAVGLREYSQRAKK